MKEKELRKFDERALSVQSEPLCADGIRILQLNLGYKCNMACKHCHIEGGPTRTEVMGEEVIEAAMGAVRVSGIKTVDLTGGAPELNPFFRAVVKESRSLNCQVIVRSNLTILFETGFEDLAEFYAAHCVEVIASVPHYVGVDVDRVRGSSSFKKSIEALRMLNSLGYGRSSNHRLHLVYNPMGAFLPPSQRELEVQYRNELSARFGITFDRLYTFANMPIGRFKEFLLRTRNYEKYMNAVMTSFNPETLESLMCRYLVSVRWDGGLFDCDFNQVQGLSVDDACPRNIFDFDYNVLARRRIVTDGHCFVCTAGQGSS